MERAVAEQIARLRHALLGETVDGTFREERPACPHCGAAMIPRTMRRKRVVLKGDETLDLERTYVVCHS